jgi:hypothetical protein
MKVSFEVNPTDLMPKPETNYRSYLLRFWRGDEPGFAWHAMLESVTEPGERHYFKDPESLLAYLLKKEGEQAPEGKGGA